MKKSFRSLTLLLLILASACIVYVYQKNKTQINVEERVSTVESKTFSFSQDNFSFTYPADGYHVEGPFGIAVHNFNVYRDGQVDAQNQRFPSTLIHVMFASTNFDIYNYLRETVNVVDASKIKKEIIGNNEWFVIDTITWDAAEADNKTYYYVRKTIDGTTVFEVTGAMGARNVTDLIVSTFKF